MIWYVGWARVWYITKVVKVLLAEITMSIGEAIEEGFWSTIDGAKGTLHNVSVVVRADDETGFIVVIKAIIATFTYLKYFNTNHINYVYKRLIKI